MNGGHARLESPSATSCMTTPTTSRGVRGSVEPRPRSAARKSSQGWSGLTMNLISDSATSSGAVSWAMCSWPGSGMILYPG